MTMFKSMAFAGTVAALSSLSFAWSIDGIVSSKAGQPLSGVKINSFNYAGVETVSAADGSFSLKQEDGLGLQAVKSIKASVQYNYNVITISGISAQTITVSVMDALGKVAFSKTQHNVNGALVIDLNKTSARGAKFLRINADGNRNTYQIGKTVTLMKDGDPLPTIMFAKEGYNNFSYTMKAFEEHNVQIIFDQEHIDTNKDDSEIIISILSAYAEADNRSRRENQIWAVKKRLKDGTSELYFRPCYGYRKTGEGIITICSDEAAVVQLIFASYLEGTSIIGIQRILQEQGIPTSRGKDIWSKRAIEKILTNEKYTGDVIARKTITSEAKGHKRIDNETEDRYMLSDVFPAIITKEMFTAVQAEMASRSNIVVDETGRHRKDTHYSSIVGKALNNK